MAAHNDIAAPRARRLKAPWPVHDHVAISVDWIKDLTHFLAVYHAEPDRTHRAVWQS